jgi:hypothetical protein
MPQPSVRDHQRAISCLGYAAEGSRIARAAEEFRRCRTEAYERCAALLEQEDNTMLAGEIRQWKEED